MRDDSNSAGKIVSIYNWETIQGDNGWESIMHKACYAAEVRDKSTVTTYNLSAEFDDGADSQVAAVVTWSKAHEDMLIDSERGGCSCLIF